MTPDDCLTRKTETIESARAAFGHVPSRTEDDFLHLRISHLNRLAIERLASLERANNRVSKLERENADLKSALNGVAP